MFWHANIIFQKVNTTKKILYSNNGFF